MATATTCNPHGLAITVLMVFLSIAANAQTHILLRIRTGSDDLRGDGNRAFLTPILFDRELPEREISKGLVSDSLKRITFTLPETISAEMVKGFRIRHDGNPRNGHPFDTYDNWDMVSLTALITDARLRPIATLYESKSDPGFAHRVLRFTAEKREHIFRCRSSEAEPDFVIHRVGALTRGVQLIVQNTGRGIGRVTRIEVSGSGGAVVGRFDTRVLPGQTVALAVGFLRGGRVTCVVSGTDDGGAPEAVTWNNILESRI